MLGLVCMLYGKGMKKGINSINNINIAKLKEATLFNIDYTLNCLEYCFEKNLFFRVSSNLIPYIDLWEWEKDKEILDGLKKIKITSKKVLLTLHPDQFVVLNSLQEKVCKNSIEILKAQYKLGKYIGVKCIIIHLGRSNASEEFIKIFRSLPKYLQNILAIENCHYYSVNETLKVAQILKIPMVLDVHHGRITNSKNYSLEEIKSSWKNKNFKPIAHISSGKTFEKDKSHNDFIIFEDVKKFSWLFENFNVAVEAKKKNLAIEDLKEKLKKIGLEI